MPLIGSALLLWMMVILAVSPKGERALDCEESGLGYVCAWCEKSTGPAPRAYGHWPGARTGATEGSSVYPHLWVLAPLSLSVPAPILVSDPPVPTPPS